MISSNVCIVTVTYGNREKYLKQLLDSVIENDNIKTIVVVDNNSDCTNDFIDSYDSAKIKWINLKENTGSANGYHVGIKEAYENTTCDFIWLLDDDNVPAKDSLNILLAEYFSLKKEKKDLLIAVQARRPKFISHQRVFSMKNPIRFYKSKNVFLDFSYKKIFSKLFFVLKGRAINTDIIINTKIKAPYTQYGGLLLAREIVDKIGYPESKLFLYADDSEYTYRITRNKGSIYIIKDAIVDDVDFSWNYTSTFKQNIVFPLLEQGNNFRVYYSVRNQVYFELHNFMENKYIYLFNKYMYLFILLIFAIKNDKYNRFTLLLKATHDGNKNTLGINEDIAND